MILDKDNHYAIKYIKIDKDKNINLTVSLSQDTRAQEKSSSFIEGNSLSEHFLRAPLRVQQRALCASAKAKSAKKIANFFSHKRVV